MSNLVRRGLTVAGIAAVALLAYQIFFHYWPHHPVWGWGFRYWGPRVFPGFPLPGLLIMVALGFLGAKLILQTSKSRAPQPALETTFCPYCGRDLRHPDVVAQVEEPKPSMEGAPHAKG